MTSPKVEAVITGETGERVTVTNGNLDVQLSDQHTPLLIAPTIEHDVDFTLATPATIDTYTFDAVGGHAITVGDVIFLKDGADFYQGIALAVSTNAITLDTPFWKTFPTSTTVGESGIANMNVVGSSGSRRFFSVGPPPNAKWDVTALGFSLLDQTAMDSSTFGGILALTNGFIVRKRDTVFQPIFNWKSNGDVSLSSRNHVFDEKAPSGFFSYHSDIQLAGQSEYGVTIRLDGSDGDIIEAVIQDDLSDLDQVILVVRGHVVV
jgi:hypothetical protein